MRWSIIRVIWLRELRDQLRDRRTIFMIAILPILLYPLVGMGTMQVFGAFFGRDSRIGILGSENLPRPSPPSGILPSLCAPPGPLGGIPPVLGAVALQLSAWQAEYPSLLRLENSKAEIDPQYFGNPNEQKAYQIVVLEEPLPPLPTRPTKVSDWLGQIDRAPLDKHLVDVLLIVPPTFAVDLEQGRPSTLYILTRERDDHSRLVQSRLSFLLQRWKEKLKVVRLLRQGLPADYDEAFAIWDPDTAKPSSERVAADLFKILTQIFPFVLVMWSLAGALYPAVDLCAGEKERGTMETLLISPASREEIVWGKFLTIWVFSAATALLNLLSMGLTTWRFSNTLENGAFHPGILLWGVLLLLPLSAFFSALCLAVGVYARSSKEGQYYLMPLFLMTMPLIFLTLVPGVELNPFYSMVPVTGVALLLQSLMYAGTPEQSHFFYFIPVLGPMVLYSWLALRWAIEQFQREEVLFREAERLDVGLWLKRLFRDKEILPSTGEALFFFGMILALRWCWLNVGTDQPLLVRTGISHLAFVAAPALFMVLLLTTRPLLGLGLRLPPWWGWPAAVVLGVLVMPPIAELTFYILAQVPALKQLLEQYHPLTSELQNLVPGDDTALTNWLRYLLVLGLLPAVCEELAFRGFILTGLARRFRPWTAIFLSSFLFALYQMNVFQFVPHFVLGLILGFLTLRTGSVFPAMIFHLVYNCLFISTVEFQAFFQILLGSSLIGSNEGQPSSLHILGLVLAIVCSLLTLAVLAAIYRVSRWETPERFVP